jgi:hypothetical protein
MSRLRPKPRSSCDLSNASANIFHLTNLTDSGEGRNVRSNHRRFESGAANDIGMSTHCLRKVNC